MHQVNQNARIGPGVIVGFFLSLVAIGVLWIGTPWGIQLLMCLPFLLAAFIMTRRGTDGRWVLLGAAPVALLIVQFRDSQGSHIQPMLLVAAWVISVLLGWWLARRRNDPRV